MANKLNNIFQTSVKFYSSLTREQALGKSPIGKKDGQDIYVDDSSVCFVADEKGNSIFLGKLLFGDGAVASGTSGGGSGGGPVVVTLNDLNVWSEIDSESGITTLHTLDEYFDSDGKVISNGFKVITKNILGQDVEAISITPQGIFIGETSILETISDQTKSAEEKAKTYADSLITSVYKLKGSVNTYNDLLSLINPKNGDVYNVVGSYGTTPAGTNWVYVEVENASDSKYPGYWDALGGQISVDLTDYVKKSDLTTAISQAQQNWQTDIAGAKNDIKTTLIDPLSNSVSTLQTDISTIKTNQQVMSTNISTNSTNITNIANQLTWQ